MIRIIIEYSNMVRNGLQHWRTPLNVCKEQEMLISISDILCTHLICVCLLLRLVSDKQSDYRQAEKKKCMYMQLCTPPPPATHLTAPAEAEAVITLRHARWAKFKLILWQPKLSHPGIFLTPKGLIFQTPAKMESGLRSNSTAEPGSKQHN